MNLEKEVKIDRRLIVVIMVSIFLMIGAVLWLIFDSQDTKRFLIQVQNTKVGIASWYAKGEYRNGTIFKGHLYSCASDYFDRYDLLLVDNTVTKKKVLVWNNDTHEATDIIVDLSRTAFKEISPLRSGKIIVKVTRLGNMVKPNKNIFGNKQKNRG